MKRALAIYIHIPFCVKKCDYCDFFSVVTGDDEKETYAKALLAEIRATKVSIDCEVHSVFFGGGTPSSLKSEWIGKIMVVLMAKFQFSANAEISIECNPGTVDKDKLRAYKSFGINRISFGLQSTSNAELLLLGRIHTYEDFLESYNMARKVGFDNISVDLMSALPGQSVDSWRESLNKIGKLGPEHISAYSLIIEAGTPFATRELALPSEDDEREMYEETLMILAEFGYHQYEISNYSRPGLECQHNIGYWERREYLGFGASAASLVNDVRYSNVSNLKQYQENSDELVAIRCDIEALDEEAKMEEVIFLGMRMMNGISNTEFETEFGVSLRTAYGERIDKLVTQELLNFDEYNLKLTRQGISVSNYVFMELLT